MYYFMNKDKTLAEFNILMYNGSETVSDLKFYVDPPFGLSKRRFCDFIRNRYAAKRRGCIDDFLSAIGVYTLSSHIELYHAISLNDTFWIKRTDEDITWRDVSPYTNAFDDAISDLSYDSKFPSVKQFGKVLPELGTSGTYDKCWKRQDDTIQLIKRGTEGFSNSGMEPYSEVAASYVFETLKSGVKYTLTLYRDKVASVCDLFCNEDVGFIAYGDIYSDCANVIQSYINFGVEEALYRMLVCDAITFNTDRHMWNYGFLFDTDTLRILSGAPAFDYNLSLFPMEDTDALTDVNAFIHDYVPKLGDKFIPTAQAVLTSDIRSDLVNLKGFEYPDICDDKFTKRRLDCLTKISNQQINKILGNDTSSVYINPLTEAVTNCYKYRLKNHMNQEQFEADVPRLMKLFGIQHMSELEEKIVDLL